MKPMRRTLLILCLILGAILSALPSCRPSEESSPPPLEQVYDRLVQVIEASHEINVLLFGEGLPVYPRGDKEDILIHRYYGVVDNGMEYVTPYAKFGSISEMQEAIAAVYSTAYRESLYESLFTGYAAENMSMVLPARFTEDEKALYMSRHISPLVTGVRVYDYATMAIEERSTATRIRVSIRSYSEDYPQEWKKVYLSFVYENGDWYLDSPSC